MSMPKIELVSFKLCPFVQRSVIMLKQKDIPYEINYIDLSEKPDWFLAISPLGKVPLLKVEGEVLFESAVINEYLDDITTPRLMPLEPLPKARQRAWIEFVSACVGLQHRWMLTPSHDDVEKQLADYRSRLEHLERALQGPLFSGEVFSLVDAALAPMVMRDEWVRETFGRVIYEGFPKLESYAQTTLELRSVRESVVDDFPELLESYLRDNGSFLAVG